MMKFHKLELLNLYMFEFLRLLTDSFIIHSLVYAFEGFEEMTISNLLN
jgi:hypothetical protein